MVTLREKIAGLRGRPSETGTLTEGAELSNASNNATMDALFENKDKMAALAKKQLSDLFPNSKEPYGRARAVGMSAAEAGRAVKRGLKR